MKRYASYENASRYALWPQETEKMFQRVIRLSSQYSDHKNEDITMKFGTGDCSLLIYSHIENQKIELKM